MKLTRVDLESIAAAINKIQAAGIEAPEIVVGEYRVSLEVGTYEGQRGTERQIFVTAIRPKDEPKPHRWGGDHPGNQSGTPYAEQD